GSVAMWGIAFKAGTDDMRDSPALVLASELAAQGVSLRVYDPTLCSDTTLLPKGTVVCTDMYSACVGVSLLCIMTEWEEFRWAEFAKVMEVMATPKILDARNLLDASAVRRMGFIYQGIGRK
ncbi:MAG: UDP binding domain-containing protein, partial [Actinobacteria bacterium]|nr:UDP binding domain-containing protein [Actinomycetota bacterium]